MGIDETAAEAHAMEGTVDVEGGGKLENPVSNVSTSEAAVKRHGTTFSACFEMFIAVMGPGSLSLASALAALGWVGGMFSMAIFAGIVYAFAHMLIMCHQKGDGKRYRTYYSAVHNILGKRHAIAMVWIQQINIVLVALAYAITGGTSLQSIALLILPDNDTSMWSKASIYVLIFSIVMLFVIQISSLGELTLVCVLGALCVFLYDAILVYLGAANWSFYGSTGSIGGAFTTPVSKMWSIFNAFGLLFFAWGCAFVLVEIVDCIDDKPVQRGRKAINAAYAMVAVILFAVGIATYGSVGDDAPGWFLNAFTTPEWLIILANIAIVLSLIPGYNLYLLPFLIMVERPLERRFPRLHPRVLKIIWRSLVVIVLAFIGALLPFFTSFTSLVGALGFWPITVYFPLEMWIKLYNPGRWTKVVLYSVSVFAFVVTLLAIVGSVESIVVSASSFTFGWQ